jgi:hypothetical protein
MGSLTNHDLLDTMYANNDAYSVYEELMENIKIIKDIVKDTDEDASGMDNVSLEAELLTDILNRKLQMLEHKAKKVGKVMNRMFSSIDEGNMLIDETMKNIKYHNTCEEDISNNLYSISRKLEKVEQYSKRINR